MLNFWKKKSLADVLAKYDRDEVVSFVLKDYLKAVTLEDVYTTNASKRIFLGNEPVPVEKLRKLSIEARFIRETEIWKILQATLTSQAHKVIFEKSMNFDDVKSGKLMLYDVDIRQKIVDNFADLKFDKVKDQ